MRNQPTSTSLEAEKGRNLFLDAARTIAAWGVIAIHVPYETWGAKAFNQIFWPTCVPFFYVAGLVFFIKSVKLDNVPGLLQKQWARLMIPYICWTVIYLALRLAKGILTHDPPKIEWVAALFYGASAVHLYFLPMLLIFQALALSLILISKGQGRLKGQGVAILVIALIVFSGGYFRKYYDKGSTGYFLAVAMYLSAGFLFASRMKNGRMAKGWGLAGLAIWVAAVAMNFKGWRLTVLDCPLLLPFGGIGFFMLAASDLFQLRANRFTPFLGLSYGIYLSHVIFQEFFEFAFAKFAHGHVVYNALTKVAVTTVIFGLAMMLTLALPRLVPAAGWLFGEYRKRSPKA
ncbi:MAG: hypothetical protein JWM59_2381 [Verrucomicrobiales bacterium]|nr:hypothetical protein [Verrucomicrobiales bacterium]